MGTGDTVSGPAIVQLPHTAVSVAPGQTLTADAVGSLVLSL
jgi:N-methylhydantoinase A/oxoprolinase/acetone carboxylase beta subunit